MIPQAIKDLFKSKKFYLTIIGSAVCAGLAFAGVSNDIILAVAGLFGVNVGSQAYQDANKAK